MSMSGSGIGGGGNADLRAGASNPESTTVGAAQINGDGSVAVAGEVVDLSTAEGTQALLAVVDAEELETIKGLMQLKEVDGPDGPILVPDDSFQAVDSDGIRNQLGPTSTTDGVTDLDNELGEVFTKNGIPSPYNANTTPALAKQLSTSKAYQTAVETTQGYLANPTEANMNGVIKTTNTVATNFPTPGVIPGGPPVAPGGGPETVNIMEILFLVFKESIKETNEDKKYFLTKLQEFNKMGEALSAYLSELVDVSRDLGAKAAGQKYPEMVTTTATIKQFDTNSLNSSGNMVTTSVSRETVDRAGLNDTIKEVEAMQETVRNKRQMASTAFQNFDQKANQLYNLLSSVMKAMNEMRMGTIRNML